MRTHITDRVVSYLDTAPTPTLPLSRVYSWLVGEVGPEAGSYGQLRSEVKQRSDLFIVLEPRHPFSPGDDGLAEPGRLAYEAALVEAGHDCSLRIALVGAPTLPPRPFQEVEPTTAAPGAFGGPPHPRVTPLDQMEASLLELWRVMPDDPVLRADLAEALSQTEELRSVLERALGGRRQAAHRKPRASRSIARTGGGPRRGRCPTRKALTGAVALRS